MSSRSISALLLLGLSLMAAQSLAQLNSSHPVDNDFVQKEFGSSCTLTPGIMPIAADLDGDGVSDLVIAARCTNPMMDQGDHDYKVIDPYFTFAGYGDPKVTTQYSTEEPANRALALLIIHGAGPDAWWAKTPKTK